MPTYLRSGPWLSLGWLGRIWKREETPLFLAAVSTVMLGSAAVVLRIRKVKVGPSWLLDADTTLHSVLLYGVLPSCIHTHLSFFFLLTDNLRHLPFPCVSRRDGGSSNCLVQGPGNLGILPWPFSLLVVVVHDLCLG